jgi:hypothetical protein
MPATTPRFRDLVAALAAMKAETFTLDGEVAVFDRDRVSRFEWLRHVRHGDVATPPLFMVFDLLRLGANDYRAEPLKIRRRALEKLIRGLVRSASQPEWLRGLGGSAAPRVGRDGREGPGRALRRRADAQVAEGQGAEVSGRGARILQAGWLTRFTVRGMTILRRVAVHFRAHQLPGRENITLLQTPFHLDSRHGHRWCRAHQPQARPTRGQGGGWALARRAYLAPFDKEGASQMPRAETPGASTRKPDGRQVQITT